MRHGYGAAYDLGDSGYPRDPAMAVEMLKRAAQANYPPAIYQLGKLYLSGQVLQKDESAGRALLHRAALLGYKGMDSRLWR